MADNQSNTSAAAASDAQDDLSEHSSSERGQAVSFWAKYTAQHLMGDCPYAVALDVVDTALWDIPATEDSSQRHVTTWVAKTIHDYHVSMAWDDNLFADYQWDFEGWTKDMFLKVERNTLRSLKTVLRNRGVYTGNNRARIADSLCSILGIEDPLPWDPVEFQAMDFDQRSKAYRRQQKHQRIEDPVDQPDQQRTSSSAGTELLQRQHPQPEPERKASGNQQDELNGAGPNVQSQSQSREQPQAAHQKDALQQPGHQNCKGQQPPYMSGAREGLQVQHQWEEDTQSRQYLQPQTMPQPATAYRQGTPFPHQSIIGVPNRPPDHVHDPFRTLPPRWCRNEKLNANTITQFSKIWDNNKKYTGDAYDLLDDKIRIFFNICWQIDIQEGQFHAVFPRILTGRAEMFYIQYVDRNDSFANAYMAIKNHFDHDVHHQHYYTDWTTTTFDRTRIENPDKDLHEVLQILLDKLQLCQRALGKNFEGEDALRTTVINACRGVPELEMALFKPATICEGLFADLRSAVETHLARQHTKQMLMGTETTEDQYYLDRRYTNNRRGRGQLRGQL
ncbi:hypothetical protein M011DRAFT_470717, partial [Sporormia fimetaria CBS 119925]